MRVRPRQRRQAATHSMNLVEKATTFGGINAMSIEMWPASQLEVMLAARTRIDSRNLVYELDELSAVASTARLAN